MKIDPVENKIVHSIPLHGWIGDLAVGGGLVWAPVVQDGQIYKLSEDDLSVQGLVPAGADPERISIGGGRLWVANAAGKTISVIDLHTGARPQLPTGAEPTTLAYHDGLVWIGAAPKPLPLPPISGQELRISTPSPSYDPDPAHAGPSNEQYLYETCANLLNYPDSAGPDGARLRPEIAAAMPSVSNGGRTYTFHIRRGFRFSPPSNEPVTAETFRHTIERTLAPSQQHGWPFGSEIAGASAYSAGNAAHISGISVHGNVLAITLVRPAGDFLTRISMFNFCPVPLSEPVHPKGPTVPSAGPYYVASSTNDRTVLLRNPTTTGSGRAARSESSTRATSGHRRRSRGPTAGRSTISRVTSTITRCSHLEACSTSVMDRRAPPPGSTRSGTSASRCRWSTISSSTPGAPCFAMLDCGVRSTTPLTDPRSRGVLRRSERPDPPAGCSGPPRPSVLPGPGS
jgi:hypothetical protein